MKILGLVGKKQSGKNTVAEYIYRQATAASQPVIELAFADALKQDVADAFGILVSQLEERKNNPIVRHTLQWYGVDKRELEQEKSYWINKLADRLIEYKNADILLVVTDCRFLNEAEFLKIAGAKLVRIRRDGLPEDDHISETEQELIGCDYTISNHGTLGMLWHETKNMLAFFELL